MQAINMQQAAQGKEPDSVTVEETFRRWHLHSYLSNR